MAFPSLAFISGIGGGELLVIFVVFLLLFGAKKLPGIARSLGKSVSEFQRAAREVREEFLNADKEIRDAASTKPVPPSSPYDESTETATDGYEDWTSGTENAGVDESGSAPDAESGGPIEPIREKSPESGGDTASDGAGPTREIEVVAPGISEVEKKSTDIAPDAQISAPSSETASNDDHVEIPKT